MKLFAASLVFVTIGVVVVDANILNDTEVTTIKSENDTLTSSSEERRWTPIFPKIGQKFNLTTKPITVRNYSIPTRTKYPVLNVIPKAVQMKGKNYWKTATTRRPVMKHHKFTVNPLSTFKLVDKSVKRNDKHLDDNKEFDRKHNNNMFHKIMDDKESSEEDSETSTVSRKQDNKIKPGKSWTTQFRKVQSLINKETKNNSKVNEKDNKIYAHKDVTTVKPKTIELSSEEEKDRTEFIFVTPTTKVHTVAKDDSNESAETTTTIEKELKLRQTRSINVIEEENLGTTISGFKFTGKVASLSNDLMFKNINI